MRLQNFHNNFLFLDQKSSDDLLPDSLVAEDTTVCAVDCLLTPRETSLLLVAIINNINFNVEINYILRCWLDTLQLEPSHGTFWE